MNVKCESKLDDDGNNKNKKKKNDKDKDEKTNLPMMCKGWPVTKDVCSSGIKKFQKQSATIIEHYIQPLITFVMFNAFLQLIVMVLAILDGNHCNSFSFLLFDCCYYLNFHLQTIEQEI